MLHRNRIKVVTRQLPYQAPVVHMTYHYNPDLLTARGIKDIDAYVEQKITEDIDLYKDKNPEYHTALFVVTSPEPNETIYIS